MVGHSFLALVTIVVWGSQLSHSVWDSLSSDQREFLVFGPTIRTAHPGRVTTGHPIDPHVTSLLTGKDHGIWLQNRGQSGLTGLGICNHPAISSQLVNSRGSAEPEHFHCVLDSTTGAKPGTREPGGTGRSN